MNMNHEADTTSNVNRFVESVCGLQTVVLLIGRGALTNSDASNPFLKLR